MPRPPTAANPRIPGSAVEAIEEQETRLGQAQADEERSEGGLAAAGGAFYQEPVTRTDPQVHTLEDGLAAVAVAEDQVMRFDHCLFVPRPGARRSRRESKVRRALNLRARCRLEEGRDLRPGNRRARQMREARSQLSRGAKGEQEPAKAYREQRRRATAGDKGRSEPNQAQSQPATRYQGPDSSYRF